MKLIFMGTPDFAVPTLDAIINAGHTVAAVYTQPDKPKGRGLEMTPPPVKKRALELGLSVYQPESVKKDPSVAEAIASAAADAIVVVAYGKLLPTEILNASKYGCINVHSSLLPRWRGAAPINWAVLAGDKVTGVSTMLLDEGMDTGDILMQCETAIDPNENAGELHDRLSEMGAKLLLETLDGLENGTITPRKQDDSLATRALMLDKGMCAVDWSESAETVHNKVRGLQPWPVALCRIGGKRVKLHGTRVAEGSGAPGEIISAKPFVIACGEGAVEITELQGEGGKRMAAADYLRGHPVAVGDRAE